MNRDTNADINRNTRTDAHATIGFMERCMLNVWVSPSFPSPSSRDYLDTIHGISGDELARVNAAANQAVAA